MARETIMPPRELTDAHTMIAQRYAGYLVGHPYRNPQQTTTIKIDRRRRWKEPAIATDDCLFCVRLTDDEAERRVDGYQYQIDIEATRFLNVYFREWIESRPSDLPEPSFAEGGEWDNKKSQANVRRFCELFQNGSDAPGGHTAWHTRPIPFYTLPLRIKRKLCIEWNHLYLPWMKENGLEYDFEKRVFWKETPPDPYFQDS